MKKLILILLALFSGWLSAQSNWDEKETATSFPALQARDSLFQSSFPVYGQFQSDTTVTVANTGADFSSISQALIWAKKYSTALDSAGNGKFITIQIDTNLDGSNYTISTPYTFQLGNASNIKITGGTIDVDKSWTSGDVLRFNYTFGLNISDLTINGTANIGNILHFNQCSNVNLVDVVLDSAIRGIAAFDVGTIFARRVDITNCTTGIDGADALVYLRDCDINSNTYGVISSRNSNFHLRDCAVINNSTNNLWVDNGGIASMDNSNLGTGGSPSINVTQGIANASSNSTLGSSNIAQNRFTTSGFIVKENGLLSGAYDTLIANNVLIDANGLTLTNGQALGIKSGQAAGIDVLDADSILYAHVTIDYASIAAGGTNSQSITITGLDTNDIVNVTPGTAFYASGALVPTWVVDGANSLIIYANNFTASPIDPAAARFHISVIKN